MKYLVLINLLRVTPKFDVDETQPTILTTTENVNFQRYTVS